MVKFTYPKGKTRHFPICPIAPSFGTVQWRIQTYGAGGGGGHPDPEIREGGLDKKDFRAFGPQFGPNVRGDTGPFPGSATAVFSSE